MTKLIQQLSFSSSIYGSSTEPTPAKEKTKNFGDGASLSAAGSKRSAISASDAECFSLCLGAGPLCGEEGPQTASLKPLAVPGRRASVVRTLLSLCLVYYIGEEGPQTASLKPLAVPGRRTSVVRVRTDFLCLSSLLQQTARSCRLSLTSVSRCAWAPGLCGGPDVPANDSAPPGGVNGGASSPATPSTPTHDDSNRDLLSALLWGSASSLSSSAESLYSEHPALQTQQQQAVVGKILERKDRQPVKIDFKIFLTENTVTRWEAVVQGNTMFLRVPGVLQAGSKESFMLLLDFAEERLHIANCIICVLKSRADRATLLRTFMFMGFAPLPPAAPLLPPELANPDYIFLHYNMQ